MRRRFQLGVLLLASLTAACLSGGGNPRLPVVVTPAPPPVGALITFEVFVHDLQTPDRGLAGVAATCGGETRTTNGDGTAHFDVESGRQLDCSFSREGYDRQTASAVPGLDARLSTWMHRAFTPVPAVQHLRVEDNRRWFGKADGTRFDFRDISGFPLVGMIQAGEEDATRAFLRGARELRFTVVRVILAYTGVDPRESGPHRPNFFPALDRLLEMAAEEGIYLRLTYLGGLGAWGATWDPVRREDKYSGAYRAGAEAFVRDVTRHICGRPGIVAELVNEPLQTGFRSSFAALVSLGREVKALCPSLPLAGGSVDGPNEGDVSFAVEPFDYVDAHLHRLTGVGGFEWVKRSGEQPLIDQDHVAKKMPFLSGEPINLIGGRGDDRDESPSVAFAYGAVSRARQYNTNFHYDGGLYGRLPDGARGLESVRCYHAGLDAIPMSTGTKWRGHWAQSFFRQVWPDTDGVREVEQHVAAGRGPWRVFGVDTPTGSFGVAFPQPRSWDWRANVTAPAELVAECTTGSYPAAVYRKH